MEVENEKTLESRLAQIEEWKRCKDDAEYRAKVKAENEYWEVVEKLKEYHKRIEDICALANKLYSYQKYCPCEIRNKRCGLYDFRVPGSGCEYFVGIAVGDSYGVNTSYYILYYKGDFYRCRNNSNNFFEIVIKARPKVEELTEIYNNFPEFERKFYEWFDEVTKINWGEK